MNKDIYEKLVTVLSNAADPLADLSRETKNNYSSLLDKIGDARFVMIGEATHGTREFYQTRIEITQQLIMKKGFMAVAIEGDWPDAYSIHRYVQGKGDETDWEQALENFERFPTWMWRNATIPPFIRWLRAYNDNLSLATKKLDFMVWTCIV